MPRSSTRSLPPAAPAGHDVLCPAAALTLAVLGTAVATISVARLTRALRDRAPFLTPEPAALASDGVVWEG